MSVLLEVWLHLLLVFGLPLALGGLVLMGLDLIGEARR